MSTTHDLVQAYVELFPHEAAHTLGAASATEVVRVLEALRPARAARLWEHLDDELAADTLARLSDDAAGRILAAADPSRTAIVLARVDEPIRARRLALVDPALARELEALMTYPPGTAGHIMDPRVYSFPASMTVKRVIAKLHKLRRKRIGTIFAVDAAGLLVGALPLLEVVMAEPDQRLEELLTAPPTKVLATAPREEIVETLAGYGLPSLPVVDFEGRLIGTIRREALVQAVQAEASAGIQTMVGASREERALSAPVFAVRKRLPWLNVNLMTAFLAAAVVGLFQGTIEQFTALAVLLPVVAGQSGNTGAQALAVTMRGLALREVRVRHWPRIMTKEAIVGLLNGLAVAVVTVAGVFVWSGSPGLCLVIGVAMVVSMVIAGVAGTAIPVILTSIGQDPAQSSSIILTTVTDVVGFFSFLGLATLLSGML